MKLTLGWLAQISDVKPTAPGFDSRGWPGCTDSFDASSIRVKPVAVSLSTDFIASALDALLGRHIE